MIKDAIKSVIEGVDLTREQAYSVMNTIMNGEATAAQVAAFMVSTKLKGETYQEIAGFAEAMRDHATSIYAPQSNTIDMCGTGGDGCNTFNISTVASVVVAGGGVPVAKHGNRAVSSQSGSADLLEALGVKIDLSPRKVEYCLQKLDIAFLFAPLLHQAMKYAIGPRREIGVRTVFNILGPLTNPARVKRQVLGVYTHELAKLLAEVLRELEAKHVLIVHSEDGLDEVSINKPTILVELKQGEITEKRLFPEDFGFDSSQKNGVLGGSPAENAVIAMDIINGKKGPERDIVVANAACGFVVGGMAKTMTEGVKIAQESIDSGAALNKLEELKEISHSL